MWLSISGTDVGQRLRTFLLALKGKPRHKKTMDSMLTSDLLVTIFAELEDVRIKVMCARVCKLWRDILLGDAPSFRLAWRRTLIDNEVSGCGRALTSREVCALVSSHGAGMNVLVVHDDWDGEESVITSALLREILKSATSLRSLEFRVLDREPRHHDIINSLASPIVKTVRKIAQRCPGGKMRAFGCNGLYMQELVKLSRYAEDLTASLCPHCGEAGDDTGHGQAVSFLLDLVIPRCCTPIESQA